MENRIKFQIKTSKDEIVSFRAVAGLMDEVNDDFAERSFYD